MKTFFTWLLLAPLIVVAIVFAVVNRHLVTIVFDPFNNDIPGLSVTMPLFLALFFAAMVGVLIGGFATWATQHRHRRSERELRAELANLRRQIDQQRLTATPPVLSGPDGTTRSAA